MGWVLLVQVHPWGRTILKHERLHAGNPQGHFSGMPSTHPSGKGPSLTVRLIGRSVFRFTNLGITNLRFVEFVTTRRYGKLLVRQKNADR